MWILEVLSFIQNLILHKNKDENVRGGKVKLLVKKGQREREREKSLGYRDTQ